ncbi:MAG: type I methionyl aminopeptidase [Marinilabiliales bacterium]
MIFLKSEEEIELIRQSNLLVSRTLGEIKKHIKPGVSTIELDKIAEAFIRDNGGEPGFLGYRGYPNTLCVSVNDCVVHGIPSSYILKEGDVVSVDCGVKMNGFYGDSAYTFEVGEVDEKVKRLLIVTKQALYKGIQNAIPGKRIGDISFAIQSFAESNGYSVVRELVGHGVGRNLHEDPQVPNYGRRGKGVKLSAGMVIAIEPMINMGNKEIKQMTDGWTIKTQDGLPSAHFEHTVAIKKNNVDILSTFDYIEKD